MGKVDWTGRKMIHVTQSKMLIHLNSQFWGAIPSHWFMRDLGVGHSTAVLPQNPEVVRADH
jgi:hypothetical protein